MEDFLSLRYKDFWSMIVNYRNHEGVWTARILFHLWSEVLTFWNLDAVTKLFLPISISRLES
jgi:hypothetical protein